jgi:hypothetical protein
MKYLFLTYSFLLAISTNAQFQLNGVASNTGANTYQLTPAANNQFGAIWYKLMHDLTTNFNVQGQINFGADPAGADGISFVMQNSCLSAGGAGGGIGYGGMSGQSMAIEFDTYQNISGTGSELNNDPLFDHIAIEKNGDVAHDASANDIIAPLQIDPVLTNVKTGNWYDFQISYNATSKALKVYFNGSLRVNITYDIRANVFGGGKWAYWGFTSSTGGHYNVQQIKIDGTLSSHILKDTTICSGSIPVNLNPFTNLKSTNLAINNPSLASSGAFNTAWAFDGNIGSRWESNFSDPQWIYVDLQSPTDLDSVVLYWEGAFASSYQIQTSNDAVSWTTKFSTTTGDGGKDKIVFSASNIRYVRMYGTVRGTSYGYSLWEFEVYGQPKYLWSPVNGTVSPDIYSSNVVLTPASTTTYSVMIPDACAGFATATMTVTIDCSLPVSILEFNADIKNNQAILQWTTSYEKNCDHFKIMRSYDGIHFEIIGSLEASHNSNTLHSYQYQDINFTQINPAYYKIISVDYDGNKTESIVQYLKSETEKVFVNIPVFENETSLILPSETQYLEYTILDILGRTIATKSMNLPPPQLSIGENLSPAVYNLLVKTDGKLTVIKINKVL